MLVKGLDGATPKELKEIQVFLKQLGGTIQGERKKCGYSQEQLAELLELNVNTIKYIEQGRRIPSLPVLFRICRALKMKVTVE